MDKELVLEIDGETAQEYDVIIGCSIGAESEIGCDGEWISGYVVARPWLLAPGGLRVALEEGGGKVAEGKAGNEGREWRAGVLWVGLVVLWVAALAVVVVGELTRGG